MFAAPAMTKRPSTSPEIYPRSSPRTTSIFNFSTLSPNLNPMSPPSLSDILNTPALNSFHIRRSPRIAAKYPLPSPNFLPLPMSPAILPPTQFKNLPNLDHHALQIPAGNEDSKSATSFSLSISDNHSNNDGSNSDLTSLSVVSTSSVHKSDLNNNKDDSSHIDSRCRSDATLPISPQLTGKFHRPFSQAYQNLRNEYVNTNNSEFDGPTRHSRRSKTRSNFPTDSEEDSEKDDNNDSQDEEQDENEIPEKPTKKHKRSSIHDPGSMMLPQYTPPHHSLPTPHTHLPPLNLKASGNGSGSSCHQCKSRRQMSNLIFCCNMFAKRSEKDKRQVCRKKYCDQCLLKFYNEKPPPKRQDPASIWPCPACRNICCCAACRRQKAKQQGTSCDLDDENPLSSSFGYSFYDTMHGTETKFKVSAGRGRIKKINRTPQVQSLPKKKIKRMSNKTGGTHIAKLSTTPLTTTPVPLTLYTQQ